MSNVKVVAALAVGALVGAALGLLLAPTKGRDLCKKVTNAAKDLADTVKNNIRGEDAGKGKAETSL